MISFNVGGIPYDNITESTFMESMIDFTNEATFKIALQGDESSPFLIGESCLVYLDDVLVMTGIIFDVSLTYDSTSHSLNYIVRDITADFADSDINSVGELTGSLSLKKIIESVLKSIDKESKIKVINEYKEIENFDFKNDKIDPEYGDNAFDYIQGLARKKQVLLSTNADGNIVIFRNNNQDMKGKIQNTIKDTENNNVISCSFSKNQTELFNVYVVRTQPSSASDKSFFGSGSDNSSTTNQDGKFTNNKIRKGRQKCIIQEESGVSKDAKKRARWLHDFSQVESSNYSITLQGHSIDGNIFKSNRLIQVDDDFAIINSKLLIKSVTCVYSNDQGSITSLDLVNKDSFKVFDETQQIESERTEKDSILGDKV